MKNYFWIALLGTSSISTADYSFSSGFAAAIRGNARTIAIQDRFLYDRITDQPSSAPWQKVTAGADGIFSGGPFTSGYVEFEVESDKAEVQFLEAIGSSLVYVNGVPRVGDIYSFGYSSLPVLLQKGTNKFLFAVSRGRFKASLKTGKPISMDLRDATLPDIILGKKNPLLAGILVKNGTEVEQKDLAIRINGVTTKLSNIQPLTNRKFPVNLKPNATGKYVVELLQAGKKIDEQPLTLRLRKPTDSYKQTFISEIDGSCQYFAVQPSSQTGKGQSLFLSLHGASVEAINQADAYSPKSWGYIVCPTNRRPYGFDWEGIGQLDAMEVLQIAKSQFETDPNKTYLTGHSMGGHGTWIIGTLFPDQFAAIAPCAGWISFQSYGAGATYPSSETGKWIQDAQSMSATLAMKQNLMSRPIFTNHGDDDRTVPIAEPRKMKEELKGHFSFQSREEPGQGHWYDTDPEPGANCVDYAPIFDLFSKTRISPNLTEINFTTPDPNVSSKCHWIKVEKITGEKGNIVAKAFPLLKRFEIKTSGVDQFCISTNEKEVTVVVDGQELKAASEQGQVRFQKGMNWKIGNLGPYFAPPKLFQDVFNHRVVFVYEPSNTKGLENWARNKAIYDAEQLWYRGNGSVDILSRQEFDSNPKLYLNRNVLTYRVNNKLAADSTEFKIQRKANRPDRLEATIEVSNPRSAKLAERIPLFTSGAWIPANTRFKLNMLIDGVEGVERIEAIENKKS